MANFYAQYPSSSGGSNPSIGVNGATAPASSTEVGGVGPDGNLHPISTDNSGVQNVNVVTSALPTGSATAANQATQITAEQAIQASVASIDTKTPTVGQKASAASSPVVIANDQSTLPISAASLPLPAGASTSALQTSGNASLTSIDGKTPALGQALAAASVPVVLPAAQISTLTPLSTVTVTQATGTNLHTVVDSSALPTGAATETTLASLNSKVTTVNTGAVVLAAGSATIGALTANQSVNNAQVNGTTVSTGNGVSGTGVQRVAIASDNTAFTVNAANVNSSTSSVTSVASSASSVSILASNASAKGRFLFNDSTSTLYLKFGTTASTTSYTVQILGGGYYEFPANPSLYTGAVDGIWSSANGNARVTELS